MAELEDKFGEILNNPNAMSQIMALAQSISEPKETTWEPVEGTTPTGEGMDSILSSIDPAMMAMGMKLLSAYQSNDNRTAGLMVALRPFVSDERHKTLDRLAQATKIAKVLHSLLDVMAEKGEKHATL